jgi:hypothetical protein
LLLATLLMAMSVVAASAVIAQFGAHWVIVLAIKLLVGAVSYGAAVVLLVRPLPLDSLESWAQRIRSPKGR